MKKVLLINPPVYSTKGAKDINPYPPLGLAYLSAALRDADCRVKILDCFLEGQDTIIDTYIDNTVKIGLDMGDIGEAISIYNPDIIGITNMFSRQRGIVKSLLSYIKFYYPEITTIVGGAHVTATEDDYHGYVDYIVIGEGEGAIVDIVKEKCQKGIVHYPLIEYLDNINRPDWDTANLKKYFGSKMSHGYRKHERFAPVQTSRGCPASCVFCTAHKTWGKKYRARSVSNIMLELAILANEYGVKEIMFEDDNLTLDPVRAFDLFNNMIEAKLNLAWDTPNGVAAWTLSKKLIDKMIESGCYNINFAIESGSQRVLNKVIRKPINLKRAKELIKYAKTTGVGVGMFLVVGLPGETKEEIYQTLRLAEDLGIYFPHISIATAYPGSELYKNCIEAGILKEDYSFGDMHIRSASISTPEWTANELEKILSWNRKKRIIKAFMNEPIKTLKRVKRRLL